jgi:purine-binding chemotaxis protein CheW
MLTASKAEAAEALASIELISFQVRNQEFCADLLAIREIRGWTEATPLPHTPDYIRGLVNLRGAVLPIIDLGARLGLGSTHTTARHARLVAEISNRQVGLLVDGVSEILSVPGRNLQPTPEVGCAVTREFVRGLFAIDGRMLTLLWLDRMLPSPEAIAA